MNDENMIFDISIHALLAESDVVDTVKFAGSVLFLSTLSLRRATTNNQPEQQEQHDFYPRSPCGERRHRTYQLNAKREFLSTLSLRRATISCARSTSKLGDFYPRSPCGERLVDTSKDIIKTINFYPRSPCGERQAADISTRREASISIHALLAESDLQKSCDRY